MKVTTLGIDLAKNVFQVHGIDQHGKVMLKKQLKRAQMAPFFINLPPRLIGIEAWHAAVRITGRANCRHWVAAQQPHIREVPVKSEQQQACLSQHRMRAQLMKMRIMQTNALRGLIYEFGIVLPEGHKRLLLSVQTELAKAQQDKRLPEVVVLSVQELLKRVDALQDDIDQLDKRLAAMVKQNQQMLAVLAIPGVGPLTASALVATTSDLSTFKSGRQFAAWLGLTPKQVGTGGKTQQLGISKRGDTYERALLINGARAVIGRSTRSSWIERLLQRRHFNVVVAAWPTRWRARSGRSWSKDKPLTRSSGIPPKRLVPEIMKLTMAALINQKKV